MAELRNCIKSKSGVPRGVFPTWSSNSGGFAIDKAATLEIKENGVIGIDANEIKENGVVGIDANERGVRDVDPKGTGNEGAGETTLPTRSRQSLLMS